jgi:Fur family transcriptional regulator, ferric uptake regulator
MTRAPHAPRVSFTDLAGAVAAMRERGLRLSTPRRLILERLFAAAVPLSAEDLSTGLALDLAVTYRNLETLEANGLVHHVHLAHGPGRYALVGLGDQEYLYCERCHTVLTVDPANLDPLREKAHQLFGFHARFTHFPIVGHCRACAATPTDLGLGREHSERTHSHGHGGRAGPNPNTPGAEGRDDHERAGRGAARGSTG